MFDIEKHVHLHIPKTQSTMNISRNTLKTYKVSETTNSFIFVNTCNITIELNKFDGSFIDGNVVDNEQTQKLFLALFNAAIKK